MLGLFTELRGSLIRRSSANRVSRKFILSRYEGRLFSPSSPRPSLPVSQSSYFWPLGMVAPTRFSTLQRAAPSAPWVKKRRYCLTERRR